MELVYPASSKPRVERTQKSKQKTKTEKLYTMFS